MKKCPYCAEEIQDEAIKCRYCGEFLKAEAPGIEAGRSGPRPAVPPVIPAATPSVSTGKPLRFPHAWFWPFLVVYWLQVVGIGRSGDASVPAAERQNMAVMALVMVIPALVLFLLFTYNLWNKLQDGKTEVSPGKAVGYLFIPVYGIFWAWRVWVGYADELNKFLARHALPPRASKKITTFFMFAIVLRYSLSWIPGGVSLCFVEMIAGLTFVAHLGKVTSDLRSLGLAYQATGGSVREPDAVSYCPQCHCPYREGFSVCADCGVPLVKYAA